MPKLGSDLQVFSSGCPLGTLQCNALPGYKHELRADFKWMVLAG